MKNKGGISRRFILTLFLISVILIAVMMLAINTIIPKYSIHHNEINLGEVKWAPPPSEEQIRQNIYESQHPKKPTDLKFVVIRQIKQVSKRGCEAAQQITSVTIKGDGSVIYVDMTDPAHPVQKQFRTSENEIKALLDLFYAIDFYSLPTNKAAANCNIDNYSTVYSLAVNYFGYTKEYEQSDNAPNVFSDIPKVINQILNEGLPSAQAIPMQLMTTEGKQRLSLIVMQFTGRELDSDDGKKILAITQQPYASVEQCEFIINKLLLIGKISPNTGNQLKENCK